MAQKKFKLNGQEAKDIKSSKTTKLDSATPSAEDAETLKLTEELHVFLTQRGLPYILITQTPTGTPIGRFSFNHEHNKPTKTVENAEWIFTNLGQMINQITNSYLRLVKFY